jgi:beta-glucosidase/6-phospho-beta-glucosidase/beta-galactosidase
MLRAAEDAGIQVIWDLCHYGWPEDIDIWSAAFPERFAAFAATAARIIKDETGAPPFVCPVNEISFWAWAGGDTGRFAPSAEGRGMELKRQLVRAAIAAIAAVREVDPDARFICAEPLIHVDPGANTDPAHVAAAEHYRRAQFEATDLLTGRLEPELGGHPDYLDVVGVNFYPDNQWYYGGPTIPLGHHAYRPLRDILAEWFARYGRPILIAETGAEGSARPSWLHYVCGEVEAARSEGVPIVGACIYPILEYSGWENDRHCATGLLSAADRSGTRHVFQPLAAELRRQQAVFAANPSIPLSIAAE